MPIDAQLCELREEKKPAEKPNNGEEKENEATELTINGSQCGAHF